jgi:hypothetical protein
MESLASLSSGSKKQNGMNTPNNAMADLISVDGLETELQEKGTRIGPRVRAFEQFFALIDAAETEGWSFDELRKNLEVLRDGAGPKAGNGGPKATGRQSFYCGVSRKGNRVLIQTANPEELREDFEHLFLFSKKAPALEFVNRGAEAEDQGTQVF